jgi:AraC-like DNA-binding protein
MQAVSAEAVDEIAAGAAVVHANHASLERGATISRPETYSRMLLWGISGRGRVVCGDRRLDIAPGVVIVLPWRHVTDYEADSVDPMTVGAAHVVPWHTSGSPIDRWVGHTAQDPLASSPHRQNRQWPGSEQPRRCNPRFADALIHLGEAAVSMIGEPQTPDIALRALGQAIVSTVLWAGDDQLETSDVPAALVRMQEHIATMYRSPMSTHQIAAAAGCSTKTAERMFRRYTGQSPQEVLRTVRMNNAARLLRGNNLRVSEVARRVGYHDPLYFSRVFSATFGVTPREYGRRPSLF